jgi:DNA-binding response OmpR family regulator
MGKNSAETTATTCLQVKTALPLLKKLRLGYIATMRILVVEDQDSIRRMIEALVTARGYEVTAVASGAKAIDVALTEPPDLVLLDLMLPGQFDGFEVCRQLRQQPATQSVPVVVISALDDTDSRARAVEAGATAYYTKPFSPMALLKEIDRLGTQSAR